MDSRHDEAWLPEIDLAPQCDVFQAVDWALLDHEGNDADSIPLNIAKIPITSEKFGASSAQAEESAKSCASSSSSPNCVGSVGSGNEQIKKRKNSGASARYRCRKRREREEDQRAFDDALQENEALMEELEVLQRANRRLSEMLESSNASLCKRHLDGRDPDSKASNSIPFAASRGLALERRGWRSPFQQRNETFRR